MHASLKNATYFSINLLFSKYCNPYYQLDRTLLYDNAYTSSEKSQPLKHAPPYKWHFNLKSNHSPAIPARNGVVINFFVPSALLTQVAPLSILTPPHETIGGDY